MINVTFIFFHTVHPLHFKKTSDENLVSENHALRGFIINPPWLNTRSTGALEAGMLRARMAGKNSWSKSFLCKCQNSKQLRYYNNTKKQRLDFLGVIFCHYNLLPMINYCIYILYCTMLYYGDSMEYVCSTMYYVLACIRKIAST